MKTLKEIIQEKLKISSKSKINQYEYHPKDKDELKKIIEKRIDKNKDADLNDIDVSDITDMSNLFYNLDPHNIDISEWNVSNVKNMSHMFEWCKEFNCNLSNWNVSNVKNMRFMFQFCKHFNSNLSNWDVSNVKDMTQMFYECTALKNKPSWYKK